MNCYKVHGRGRGEREGAHSGKSIYRVRHVGSNYSSSSLSLRRLEFGVGIAGVRWPTVTLEEGVEVVGKIGDSGGGLRGGSLTIGGLGTGWGTAFTRAVAVPAIGDGEDGGGGPSAIESL